MYDEYDFMEAQVHRIEVDKWVQGERQHSDPGNDYVIDWVYNNAKWFRDCWQTSLCKDCNNLRCCGYNALSACDGFDRKGIFNEENTMS